MENKLYSFKRYSELYVIRDGIGYQIGTLSTLSASQTISEKTISRKSQFSRLAPKKIINRNWNVGSGAIEFYYSSNCVGIQYLLESLDFTYLNNYYFSFNNEFSNRPEYLQLAVFNTESNRWLLLEDVVITNLDVGLSPESLNLMNVGFSYAKSSETTPNAIMQKDFTSNIKAPSFINLKLDDASINSVRTAAFTITRTVNWLTPGTNQFNIGEVATSNSPYITSYDITATATINDVVSDIILNSIEPKNYNLVLGNGILSITIPEARITTRRELESIQQLGLDIKHQSLQDIILGGNTQ